ncbi:arsenate reductase (glutaredoxin) [Acetobacter estunensis]|uniref:arsenate reductase (glutaredoxin) n=1 Tax=Acetobacter estunensis TaxID=104097 RepID=UPI001C2CFBC4|nr:arsenate reductase (glutaredoxin) [Acetobacter estunensis]MBV1836472.1 arsenate reductase (glutaredoxin) [Acetobacter estunensis]
MATLYHNPRCGTSRKVLARMQDAGLDVLVIEYLKTPPDRETLEQLTKMVEGNAQALLRSKEPLAAELKLTASDIDDARILDAIAAHPILLNRPIAVTERGARVCRPAEQIEDLLDA